MKGTGHSYSKIKNSKIKNSKIKNSKIKNPKIKSLLLLDREKFRRSLITIIFKELEVRVYSSDGLRGEEVICLFNDLFWEVDLIIADFQSIIPLQKELEKFFSKKLFLPLIVTGEKQDLTGNPTELNSIKKYNNFAGIVERPFAAIDLVSEIETRLEKFHSLYQ